MTLDRSALVGLVVSTAAVGAAYGSALLLGRAPSWAPWSMVAGIAGAVVSLMVMGASRRGRIGSLAYPFAGVFLVLGGGFGAILAMSPHAGPEAPLWLGLPPRAAVLLYGVGGLLLLFVPAAYALTFDRLTLDEDDWERIRRRAPGGPAGPDGGAGPGPAAGAASETGAEPSRDGGGTPPAGCPNPGADSGEERP